VRRSFEIVRHADVHIHLSDVLVVQLPRPGSEPQITEHTVHGHICEDEGTAGHEISVDSEGDAKAGTEKNKYLAPLALGVLAAPSLGREMRRTMFSRTVSSRCGLLARVVTVAASNRSAAEDFTNCGLSRSI
jgi:hypothetical protein